TAGVEYEWVVAMVVDPDSRSQDVLASGYIQRVEPSPALAAKLATAVKSELPAIYAEEGNWYDALDALSNLIEARPDNKDFQIQRASLLQQVGLTNAAAFASAVAR